jgi:DNA-binding transcriptional MerR regulator
MSGTAATQSAEEKEHYRIGEVSRMTELKPFVLRYWETEFPMLEPVKSPSGHRLYRREDVDMVLKIKRLLYDEGFTIAGARRHLRDPNATDALNGALSGTPGSASAADFQLTSPDTPNPATTRVPLLNRKMLLDLRDSLRAFLTLLERR